MTALVPIGDDDVSHPDPPPEKPARPEWLGPLLVTSALILIAVIMIFVVPNALGDAPSGGCGGG